MTSARATVITGLLLLLAPAAGRADDNHYQNYLVGERATGLGGAFTAISDDSSGAYYNPAGLAEAGYSSLSLSASVYGFSSQSYDLGGPLQFESDNRSFISYPTTAAWIQRVRKGDADGAGRVQLALSIVTPQTDVLRKRIVMRLGPLDSGVPGINASTDLLSVQISEDDTLWVGVSAAWKPARWLAVGATIYGTMRKGLYQLHNHALVTLDDGLLETGRYGLGSRIDIDFSHYGLLGVVGALLSLGQHLRLGASFRSPLVGIRGRADFNAIASDRDDASGSFSFEAVDLEGATFRDRQPFKAAVGAAWIVPRAWGVSLDLSIHGPTGEYAIFASDADPSLESDLRMKKRVVWQLNAGGEYYIAGTFPLRLGFFTNRSSLADFDTCLSSGDCGRHSNLLTDGVDLYGCSGSAGWETRRATLTLGFSYNVGWATEELENGLSLETTRSFLLLSLGGTFRF